MFTDVAVFVNPKDKKYKKIIGKFLINPINGQPLKVYADAYVDMGFGTGVMRCTPAHDFADYQLAIKHGITEYNSVINFDGTLNNYARTPENRYVGIDRLVARNDIVNEIKKHGLLIKVEDHNNEIAYSERSGAIIEPLLSEQ
jgi:valyl-tRNA synthetase